MRGGDHHADIAAHGAREHGHAGRGNWAREHHIHADGGEAGDQRVFDHVAGEARILADQHAMAMLATLEDEAGGLAHLESEFRRDLAICAATNAIRAEIFPCHVRFSPLPCAGPA